MTKSYDLSNAEDLIKFDEDCLRACCHCPQFRRSSLTVPFDQNDFSIAKFFIRWYKDPLLWDKGYARFLSEKAQNTFDRYAILKRKDLFDTDTSRLYKNDDYLTVVKKYVYEKR